MKRHIIIMSSSSRRSQTNIKHNGNRISNGSAHRGKKQTPSRCKVKTSCQQLGSQLKFPEAFLGIVVYIRIRRENAPKHSSCALLASLSALFELSLQSLFHRGPHSLTKMLGVRACLYSGKRISLRRLCIQAILVLQLLQMMPMTLSSPVMLNWDITGTRLCACSASTNITASYLQSHDLPVQTHFIRTPNLLHPHAKNMTPITAVPTPSFEPTISQSLQSPNCRKPHFQMAIRDGT